MKTVNEEERKGRKRKKNDLSINDGKEENT